ncbi:MAG: hypothetical protein A2Z21_00590 [Candidatus Fraserbacteria bacterium RBG_16_55_9]|uniref:Sialidase domain-containing protein n=1 Tax=Fraserbacteria sp. (strain RBG_16_55_9) TaxID=1817864 RepID=A0A1F5UXG3_FRAXR|nr:MAG: hypothetical protein A2Z21_00590 [Candidatus Fraserbacteria bacterium RBG_16_55_9]
MPTLVVGPNVKVIRDNNNQSCATRPTPALDCANYMQNEPPLAIDPTDPNVLISGSNDYRLIPINPAQNSIWLGYYRSEDGGKTWTNTLVPGFFGDNSPEGQASPLQGVFFTGDPVVAFDSQGNAYMGGIGLSADEDLVLVAKYSDHGKTFDRTTVVNRASAIQGQFIDKPCIAVDQSGGANEGTVYAGWSRFSEIVVVARSTDGGARFSDPVIASGTRAPTRTCAVAVGPDGTLYVVWRQFAFGTTRNAMIFNLSRDGGRSFDIVRPLQTITPYDQARSSPENFRTTSFPTIAADEKGVYIAWEDARFQGASRVLLICSSNGGQTWTEPMRVANVERGHQIMPQVFADGTHVGVAFYDSRNDPNFSPANSIGDAMDVYYVEYPSGCPLQGQGTSMRVTDRSFNPNLRMFDSSVGSVPFIGDYIGVASDGENVHVVWTDNRDVKPQPLTNPPCVPTRIETLTQGCRNQNIYMATITRR